MLPHSYNIIIDSAVGTPGHGEYVADGLNFIDKIIYNFLMAKSQVNGSMGYDNHTAFHNYTYK